MYKLGLTGSIGSGKSTTAAIFAEKGCAVWDADAAVHRLYGPGGAATVEIAKVFPKAVTENGVDRSVLKSIISNDPSALKSIETIVHPLVLKDRLAFIENETADILVFDIPLLFETKAEGQFDSIATVWVDSAEQRRRVLARGTMTEQQLDLILSKQIPADEKRARADHVIITDTVEHARTQVAALVRTLRERIAHA